MRTVQIRGYCPYSAPLLLPRSWIATKKKGKREYQTWIQTSEWRCGCVKEEDICGGFLDHYLGRPGPERYGGVGREMRLPAHLALEHGYFQRSRLSVVPPPCTFLQYHYLLSHFVYRFWVLKTGPVCFTVGENCNIWLLWTSLILQVISWELDVNCLKHVTMKFLLEIKRYYKFVLLVI